jgi:glycosyltransferase involved in cell wall biosynthesis
MIACACDPLRSMESRLGWNRALHSARSHETWVLHDGKTPSEELARHPSVVASNFPLHFVDVDNSPLGQWIGSRLGWFWMSYRQWHKQVLAVAERLHRQQDFDLVHQVNYCGYREPGYAWRLGVPFVWGPVGGTQNFPLRFVSQCDPWGGLREALRNVANAWQLRFSPRVLAASGQATAVLAATRRAQADLAIALGIDAPCQLETGVDQVGAPRAARPTDRPFRILWAGRLRAWKGLPLLLKALAQLPPDFPYEVRVLGVGSSQRRWQRQAERLGVADRITWVGWPSYDECQPYYAWADTLVFTSLRDTSGTGLLEALAAGTPVIALDHQGAADILTSGAGIPIEVTTPRQVIGDIANAILRLGQQPSLWLALSRGAQQRAHHYTWEQLAAQMDRVYQQVLGHNPVAPRIDEPQNAYFDSRECAPALEASPLRLRSLPVIPSSDQ